VRFALLAMCLVVFSCDLKPAPKARESPPAPAKTADPSESAARPAPASDVPGDAGAGPSDAGAAVPADAMTVRDDCVNAGVRVAEIVIETATDPAQKAALVQDRARIVRRSAEACTRDNWSPEEVACVMAGKTGADINKCRKPTQVPSVPQPDR
jgi:hypothetical protein